MNSFNPEASGLGEFKTGQNLDDHELAQAAVIDFFGGESRYPTHNDQMIQKLENFDLATPGLKMAVELHDIVDHGLVDPKSDERRTDAQEIIYKLYEDVEDKHEFLYALGCAISTATWESDVAEVWRYADKDQFPDVKDEDWQQVNAAIHKNRSEPISEDVLKRARITQLDTSSLHDAMNDRDVEGLLIKSIELLDNLENPPKNPDSVWRDCVETLNCYGPALELFGFKELATELNGKALKYFYDDPEITEKTNKQLESSLRYHDDINAKVPESISHALEEIGEEYGIDDLRSKVFITNPRVKSEGSMRKKFASEAYKDTEQLPDGIGYKIVVMDYLFDGDEQDKPNIDQMIIDIAKSVKGVLAPDENNEDHGHFIAKHTKNGDDSEEDFINNPKKSGYSAYHTVYQYQANGDSVPVEIQVVSSSKDLAHTYDTASHVLYKAGSVADEDIIKILRAISLRAEQLREKPNNQELKPQTWFEFLRLLPEMDTPIHKTFDLVELPNSSILVADGIAEFAEEALAGLQGLDGDIVLPPSEISEEDFFAILRLLSPALAEDESVLNAVEFVKRQDLKPRRDGISAVEGHLLPVALHAAINASLSSVHWESNDSIVFLSDTVVAALFHDMVEDVDGDKAKQAMKQYILKEYGPTVSDIVAGMTSPQHIMTTHKRREAYAAQVSDNPRALLIKTSDRSQNHTSDIVRLSRTNPDEHEMKKIEKYLGKTNRHMAKHFKDETKLPKEYRQAYKAIMELLEQALALDHKK